MEKAFRKLEEEDDAAVEEIEKWSDAAGAASATGEPQAHISLPLRIKERLGGVKRDYEDFVQHHPDYVRARLAYGSFLNQSGDAEAPGAVGKGPATGPENPAVWNNLGNFTRTATSRRRLSIIPKPSNWTPARPFIIGIWRPACTCSAPTRRSTGR